MQFTLNKETKQKPEIENVKWKIFLTHVLYFVHSPWYICTNISKDKNLQRIYKKEMYIESYIINFLKDQF